MFDDDDAKRRRNLMAYCVAVCMGAVFSIDLTALLDSISKLKTDSSPWKVSLVGLVVLIYLVWRYAIRSRDANTEDANDWRFAVRIAMLRTQSLTGKWANKTFLHKTVDLPRKDGMNSRLDRTFEPLLKQVELVTKGNSAAFRVQACGHSSDGKSMLLVFAVELLNVDGTVQAEMELRLPLKTSFQFPSRRFILRSWLYALIWSKQSIDHFVPYWLALSAATVLLSKLAHSI